VKKATLARGLPAGLRATVEPLKRLLPYLGKHRGVAAAALICSVLSQGATLIGPKILQQIVAVVLEAGQRDQLPLLAGAIVAVAAIKGALSFAEIVLGARAGLSVVTSMRADLYAHLTRLSFGYFDRVRTGQLLSRITSDLEPVGGFCTWGFRMIFRSVILFAGVLAVCIWMNPRLALLSLSTMPLLTATAYFVGERIRPAFERAREQLGVVTTRLQENLSGIRIVKLYVREPLERERFRAASEVLRDRNYEAQRIDAAYYPLTGFWAGLSGLLVLWIGGMEVLHGRLTLPEYVAFEAYLLLLLLPMRMLGYMVSGMQRAAAAINRLTAILDEVPDVRDPERPVRLGRIEGAVRFENVTFGYTRDTPVLRGVSFSVRPGETVGILGATGSGKSTLVALIPRFYDPQEGVVRIDGHDVRALDRRELRRQIGIVFQESFLFTGTIRENIAFGHPDATDAEVEEAARKADIHDFVASLELGYQTPVGERGLTLSGGQQQRVALARALLTDPRILILDDCTSSLDTRTEHRIQTRLASYMAGRTTFIIAQRASSVARADRIFVLENGAIVEEGAPDDLLRNPESLFARLYQLQEQAGSRAGESGLPAPASG